MPIITRHTAQLSTNVRADKTSSVVRWRCALALQKTSDLESDRIASKKCEFTLTTNKNNNFIARAQYQWCYHCQVLKSKADREVEKALRLPLCARLVSSVCLYEAYSVLLQRLWCLDVHQAS